VDQLFVTLLGHFNATAYALKEVLLWWSIVVAVAAATAILSTVLSTGRHGGKERMDGNVNDGVYVSSLLSVFVVVGFMRDRFFSIFFEYVVCRRSRVIDRLLFVCVISSWEADCFMTSANVARAYL
jgi:hypothetical protein